MPHQVGVIEALQDYGFRLNISLLLLDGWSIRGSSTFSPHGSVNHHTAGAATGVLPSLGVLVNGRPGVPGPLCNAAQDRLNRIWMIAAGRANHAGTGDWKGLQGNSSVWGLEVEHIGTTLEPIEWAQWNAMWRFHAAVADFSGFDAGLVCQHFEWAPERKIDFVKPITNPTVFRQDVDRQRPISDPIPKRRKRHEMFAIRAPNRPWAVCIPSQSKSFMFGSPAWVATFIPEGTDDEWRPDEEFYSLARAGAFEVEGKSGKDAQPGETWAIKVGDRDWDNCIQATREARRTAV